MEEKLKELVAREFSHIDSVFFNTAYFGPSPISAKKSVLEEMSMELDPTFRPYSEWMGVTENGRKKMATMVGCPADNIFHSTSTSEIINIIVNGYSFKNGDVVCAIDKDYPSNILPWMLGETHYPFKFCNLRLEDQPLPTTEWLETTMDPNCRILNISHVSFDTGKKIDLVSIGKLCRSRDILFVVDATQSFGGMGIKSEELEYIDVLAVSTYKWMLGPYGHAFGYISDSALEKVKHKNANWISSTESKDVRSLLNYTIETLPKARKFDRGQAANLLCNACLDASMELMSHIGLETIENYNKGIRNHFLDNFPKKKYQLLTEIENMGNIVALKPKSIDSPVLEDRLKSHNIDISTREGNVRISFHLFNTTEQVEKLIDALNI